MESSTEIGDYSPIDSSNLNLTSAIGTDDINTNKRLPMMLTLAMSKCPSSVDIQQHPSSTVNHQMTSFKGGGAVATIDYRSNCSHQMNAPTSSSRFDYNSLQKQTSTTTSSNAGAYLIDNGDEHNPTAVALNSMYQCNDAMCNNGSRLFNRRSLTLMRPPSSSSSTTAAATTVMAAATANTATNVSNLYNDQYLRQFRNKLPKLQSFISTPDLTSESSRADDTNRTDDLDEQMLALMPPPPPAMPLLTSKTLSTTTAANSVSNFARPDVIQLHTFRCFHHHKHNQAGATHTMPSKSTTNESIAISNVNENSGKQTESTSGKV